MPHITLFEELALKEGRQEGILQNAREAILDVLDTRFGEVSDAVREHINTLDDDRTLKDLLRRAARVPSLDEFSVAL